MTSHKVRLILVTTILTSGTGCVSVNSPMVTDRLKLVSAGHTGCSPDENEISNVTAKPDGSGMWNATCKGKRYLCTSIGLTGNTAAFSCAPVPP
jgi:hypothetical protein